MSAGSALSGAASWPTGLRRAAALVAVAAALLAPAPPVQAAAGAPSDWAATCSSKALGLGEVDVRLADELDDDRNPDGSPVRVRPDGRGRHVPVIMVHGWVSRSTHDAGRTGTFSSRIDLTANRLGTASGDRSLIGQLQRIPGAAVFTFDYRDYAARWVDDEHLGPALGKVIDCLYARSGEEVVVVGHSMGGLIARHAVNSSSDGEPDRAGKVSTVVTFGTPNTGSLAALLSDAAADAAATTGPALAVVRLLLAGCGRLASDEVETGTLCDKIPPPARTFDSQAGVALRAGSPELAALEPFPRGVTVDALAGDATFTVPRLGWFGTSYETEVGTGDLIVGRGSALDPTATRGTDLTRTVSCAYQLDAARGLRDDILLKVGLISKADVAASPLGAFSGPCFHTSLMRSVELTNEATGAISDDIAARQPVTGRDLLAAPVPASCQHEAGRLTDGALRGLPPNTGDMKLAWKDAAAAEKAKYLRLGDFDGDGRGDALAVLDCYAGGVDWPQILAYYTRARGADGAPALRLSAWNYTTDLVKDPSGERGDVLSMSPAAGSGTTISYVTQQDGDAGCCPTALVTATLGLAGKKITVTDVSVATEQPAATRFLADLAGGRAPDPRLVSSSVSSRAQRDLTTFDDREGLRAALGQAPTCLGLVSPVMAFNDNLYTPNDGGVERVCYVRSPSRASPGAGNVYAFIGLSRVEGDLTAWRVTSWAVGYFDPYFEPGFDRDADLGD